MKANASNSKELSDAQLVTGSISGDRNAFGQIVTRYQTLVCSLAYNATGNLTESEDLAQETFLIAWKRLMDLRDSEKLGSWLCGIVRNLVHRWRRSQRQEPTHGAERIDVIQGIAAADPVPRDRAVSLEEEAIMWQALERIPAPYREPLILFYREHRSVERVAKALEVSEAVVKQRLLRGRKLLRHEVMAFVTGALKRSAPSSVFANAVIAAIPISSGGLAAKAGAAKASGVSLGLLFANLGLCASLTGSIATIHNSSDAEERRSKKRLIAAMWFAGAALWIAQQAVENYGTNGIDERDIVTIKVVCYFVWALIVTPLVIVYIRRHVAIARNHYKLSIRRRCFGFFGACAVTLGSVSWLIDLTWQLRDFLALYIVGAVTGAVLVWYCALFYRPRLVALVPIPWSRLAWVPTTAVVGIIVLLVNWRLDRWIALIRGKGMADTHAFLPMWIVHASTLIVVGLAVATMIITRPNSNVRL